MAEKKRVLARVEQFYVDNPPASVDALKRKLLTLASGALYRKPSLLLPDAGLGLFNKQHLNSGDLITWYGGAYVTPAEFAHIKRTDKDYMAYARSLDLAARQRVFGNYIRNEDGQLVKVPRSELGHVFLKDGAAQFMNGMRSYADSAVNVGNAIIRGQRRMGSPFDEDRLVREFPSEIVSVAVALTDIPPDTELIIPYGDEYFDRYLNESSHSDDDGDDDDEGDDEDRSTSLNSDDDESLSLHSESSSDVEEPPTKKPRFRCVICQGEARWQCSACKKTHYCSPTCQERCDAVGHCDCRHHS